MLTNTDRLQLRQRRLAASLPVLRGGFRPFFLGAGVWALVSLALWLAVLFGWLPSDFAGDPLAWHRHEMLFGFVGAAIAGFALTAVPNWTGRLPIAGWPLAALFAGWLAGRLLPLGLPPGSWPVMLSDGAFYGVLALILGREIIQSRNKNLPIVVVIGLFGLAATVDRLEFGGVLAQHGWGWRGGLALALLLIALIGGRIVPSFTRNWLAAQRAPEPLPTQPGQFDQLALGITGASLLLWLMLPDWAVTGGALLLAGVANAVRLARWQGWRCTANPLLLVLHGGYLWLALGLGLLGMAQFQAVPQSAAIHALSAGAMATMILAVMSRASLGHTGRPLVAGRITVVAYLLLTLAAATRVLAALAPEHGPTLLGVAGLGWLGAFALFLFVYLPILCGARVEPTIKGASQ